MRQFSKLIIIGVCILSVLINPAAQVDEDDPLVTVDSRVSALKPLAREAFELKVAELVEEKLAICKSQALENAAKDVDSLIIEEAIMKSIHDANIPWKPEKPELPEHDFNSDSLKVAPLFDSIK
jgi:hypothetical protein